MFSIQIEFSEIFDKFLKIPLIKTAEGGWPAIVVDDGGGRWF